MLLAFFLLQLAAGLYLFLPLVGRRVAGTKFYRLIFITVFVLAIAAALTHYLANSRALALLDLIAACFIALAYFFLKWPKRLIFSTSAALAGASLLVALLSGASPPLRASGMWAWSSAISGAALLGSVTLAMLLGHWYLVVRGMPIDPLSRLTTAVLAAAIVRILLVAVTLLVLSREGLERDSALWHLAVRDGIFFWMRVGWGLIGPVALYPMIRGTVRLRSTMAATGILYVAVVAVFIGEILAAILSASSQLPV